VGHGGVLEAKAELRARQPDLRESGANRLLPRDERCATRGAALLSVEIGETNSLSRDPVDVRRLVSHHALVITAWVVPTDVVTHDEEDVRLARLCRRHGLLLRGAIDRVIKVQEVLLAVYVTLA